MVVSGDFAEAAVETKPLPRRLKPKFSKEQSLDFSEGYGSMGGTDSVSEISAFQASALTLSVPPASLSHSNDQCTALTIKTTTTTTIAKPCFSVPKGVLEGFCFQLNLSVHREWFCL